MTTPGQPGASETLGMVALGRASLVYALGGLAYKGVALASIPVLARLLTPVELGLLDFAAVLASVVGLAVAVGSDQGVAYLEPRTEARDAIWESSLTIIAVGASVLLVIAGVFGESIALLLTGAPMNGPIITAAALYGGVLALTATTLNAVRLRGTPRAYALASFAIVTAEMAAALAVAWLLPGEVGLMVVGWAIAALVVGLPILARHLPPLRAPRADTMRRLIGYGAPLVPAAIAWLIGDAWIRSTLARDVDLASLGAYGIAHRIASVLGLAITGFGVAWLPYIFRSSPHEVVPRAAGTLWYLVLTLAGLGAVLTALSPEIVALVAGDAYASAREAVAALCGGMVAMGVFVLVGAVTAASGSTSRIAVAALAGVSIQAASAVPLIAAMGLSGAGIASLLGYSVAAALLVARERSLLGGRPGMLFGGAVGLSVLALTAAALSLAHVFPLRLGLVIVVGLAASVIVWSAAKRSARAVSKPPR